MKLAWAAGLVLFVQATAPPAPVPPASGGATIVTDLASSIQVRLTAAGKLLRTSEQTVEEHSACTVTVVRSPDEGFLVDRQPLTDEEKERAAKLPLDKRPLTDEEKERVVKLPTAPAGAAAPYVRVEYADCRVKISEPDLAAAESDAAESNGTYVIERGRPDAPVHSFYDTPHPLDSDLAARVRGDADPFVAGPRLAPILLGRELKEGEEIDVPPAALAPLVAQAARDATLLRAKLTFRGAAREGGLDLLRFAIALDLTWKGAGELAVDATLALTGDLALLKATAQVFRLDVSGDSRCSGTTDENGVKLEVAGGGKLTFHYRAEPLPEK